MVGKLAAHTPSRFNVFSSVFVATTRGGAHWKLVENNDDDKDDDGLVFYIHVPFNII